jgi:GNAT superfamily N-acetyltransferase
VTEREALIFHIRAATPADAPALLRLIAGLVTFEHLEHELVATEDTLRRSFFGPHPAAEAILGCVGDEPIAIAVFYPVLSTAYGRPSLYLEDLFIEERWRRHGYGRRMFAQVAAIARARDCDRLEWDVLDWNEPAMRFYRELGARPLDRPATVTHRLDGDALDRLAAAATPDRPAR